MNEHFLPGVPANLARRALAKAGGNEIRSGKFTSPESSAALAVNAFGWFVARPDLLPAFPGLDDADWPALRVDVERQMRFPWSGGRHPWLDAAVETQALLIGVESKQFEPFRDGKHAVLSPAYDRDDCGEGMQPWLAMRDRLRTEPREFRHVDAAQLVKHAFGLVTEARRIGKRVVLLYLFAEPSAGRPIAAADFVKHRREVACLSEAVRGAAVSFSACSYREGWPASAAKPGPISGAFSPGAFSNASIRDPSPPPRPARFARDCVAIDRRGPSRSAMRSDLGTMAACSCAVTSSRTILGRQPRWRALVREGDGHCRRARARRAISPEAEL